MTRLCELAEKYGTDKYPWYTPFYHALLEPRVETTFSVLEIGVLNGASLRMWQEYFYEAKVWGLDIVAKPELPNVMQGDQANPQDLAQVIAAHAPFDVVIDDGSHKPEDQVFTAMALMPYMRSDGLYIIEDVNPPISSVVDNLPFPNQYVECRVAGSDKVGRCVVIHCK